MKFFQKNKALKIGIIAGIVLAVVNQFTLGFLGGIAFLPIALPFSLLGVDLFEIVFGCHGEDCWGEIWVIGTLWLLMLPTVIGYIIQKRKTGEQNGSHRKTNRKSN